MLRALYRMICKNAKSFLGKNSLNVSNAKLFSNFFFNVFGFFIKSYILSRAKLLITVWDEIPCTYILCYKGLAAIYYHLHLFHQPLQVSKAINLLLVFPIFLWKQCRLMLNRFLTRIGEEFICELKLKWHYVILKQWFEKQVFHIEHVQTNTLCVLFFIHK